jgi:hypothetical protein
MLIAVGNSALAMVHKTPTLYTLKLSWDSERPASNDITLGKRKKSAVGDIGQVGIVLTAFLHQGGLDKLPKTEMSPGRPFWSVLLGQVYLLYLRTGPLRVSC